MNRTHAYLALAAIGLVAPYSQFVPWLFEHGFDPARFFGDLFVNKVGAFFAMDVLVSAVVLFTFMEYDKSEGAVRRAWIAMTGTVLVGVSFGLPMYLYLRERKRRTAVHGGS